MRKLRVMTLNLWNDRGDVHRRMEAAVAATRSLEVDVIGLQEVREVPGALEQARLFADAIGGEAFFSAADPGSERGPIGNAVVTRLPGARPETLRLPSPPGDPRVALAVDVETEAGPVAFLTTHLTWQLEASPVREEQVVALDRFARTRHRELPTVLTGDFNASPDTDTIRFLTGRASLNGCGTYWRDAYARIHPHDDGWTWSARNPQVVRYVERNRRIDYVFVGPLERDSRGAILDAWVALDQPDKSGVFPSDHFAVVVDIALDPVEHPR
jgi:endonuclease/exonuclease/phosphatase family metal-dependent hydrolase